MPKYYTNNFTEDQETQIEIVHNCVTALLDSMLAVPDYLKESNLQGLREFEDAPIKESEIADVVADYLSQRGAGNIFYPTHVEAGLEEWIQDTYNENEIYEDSDTRISREQWYSIEIYLNFMIAEHVVPMNKEILEDFIIPLKKRFNSGERTVELFNEIRNLEEKIKI